MAWRLHKVLQTLPVFMVFQFPIQGSHGVLRARLRLGCHSRLCQENKITTNVDRYLHNIIKRRHLNVEGSFVWHANFREADNLLTIWCLTICSAEDRLAHTWGGWLSTCKELINDNNEHCIKRKSVFTKKEVLFCWARTSRTLEAEMPASHVLNHMLQELRTLCKIDRKVGKRRDEMLSSRDTSANKRAFLYLIRAPQTFLDQLCGWIMAWKVSILPKRWFCRSNFRWGNY